MKRIFFIIGLLFSTTVMKSVYNVGTIDSISGTNNGGTGYGNATQASALGYVTTITGIDLALNGSAIQPDGKTVVVGSVGSISPTAAFATYNINGTIIGGVNTISLAGTTTSQANAVTVLSNGKIIIVGRATVSGSVRFFIAQFLPSGALDTAGFGGGLGYVLQSNIAAGSVDIANAVIVDSFGDIYVIGTSTQGGLGCIFVAKYDSSGGLDTSDYNPAATVYGGGTGATIGGIGLLSIAAADIAGNGAAIDADRNVVIAGSTSTLTSMLVTRFLQSGAIDTGFNTTGYNTLDRGGNDVAYAVGFQSTGKIIIAGTAGVFGAGVTNVCVARYLTNGLLDSFANDPASPFGSGNEAFVRQGYINDRDFGGLPSIAHSLAIQSDDKIVIGGTVTLATSLNQSLLVARFLADGSDKDTTFANPDGYTATYVASLDNGNTMSMQENGSFIVAGAYTASGHTNFIAARYLGDIPQGCIDYAYNPAVATSPGTPGYSVNPTEPSLDLADLPKITAICPASNGNIFVAASSKNNSFNENAVNLAQLNSAGQVVTISNDLGVYPTYDMIMNSAGQVVRAGLFVGSARGAISYLDVTTGTAGSPGSFHDGAALVEDLSSSFKRVCQQKSGRYVVMGQSATAANGLLIAYTNTLVLENYTQAAPFGTGGSGAQTGYITMTNATFYDMIIDDNDDMYVAYSDGTTLKIAKYLADGSGLDTSFSPAGSPTGTLNTGLNIAQYTNGAYLSFDASVTPNILFGASRAGWLTFDIITPTGSISSSGNIGIGAFDTAVLTKLQCDTNNRMIFTGYDNNNFFVGRCGSGVVDLDTTFAPNSSYPGILKTNYSDTNPTYFAGTIPPYRFSNSVCISTNGAILFGGYENVSYSDATTVASTTSVVGQVVGNTGGTVYTQVPRFPGALFSGQIDTTFGTDGALDLKTGITPGLPFGQAKVINVLASHKILVADTNGTNTVLAQLTSAYALDTASFGGGDGLLTLTDLVTPTALLVDTTAANYYVLGLNSTPRAVVYKVNAAGTSGGTALITTQLTAAYGIVQQASGRILIAGKDTTNTGVIVAYTPEGVLDTSFNPSGETPGYWSLELTNPITAISIGSGDYADKIYFAYDNVDGNAAVGLLLENGTALDANFTFGTVIASVSDAAQIRMQLDSVGNIVLVTNASGVGIKAARYTAAGANHGSQVTVMATTAGQVLENIVCLSDGSTLVLAAEPTSSASTSFMQIARLTGGASSFALDPLFNPSSGLLTTNVPSSEYTPVMKDFYALDVISTGGILVSGDNSQTAASADPYFTKIFNTSIVTKVSQSTTALGTPGQLDTTFNAAGTNAGFMNLAAELTTDLPVAATTVTSLLQSSNGSYYIGATGSTNSYVTMMSDDDVQNTAWGNTTPTLNGLLTLTGKANLSAMMFTQSGSILIAGGSGSSGSLAGWAVQCSPVNGALNTSFAPTTSLDVHCAIGQQSTGRIIIAGLKDGRGTLIAYDPVTGAVDTTFGNNGYLVSGYVSQLNSMLIDAQDNIYVMLNDDADDMLVMKLTPNAVDDATSTAVIWSYLFSGNPIIASSNHLAFDQDNNIIAAGVRQDGPIQILILNASTGSLITNGSFNMWGSITSVFVDTQVGTSGRIYVTGYNIAGELSPYIACLKVYFVGPYYSIDFDTTFGSGAGYVSTPIPGTTATDSTWNAGMINANGKITVAGYGAISTVDTPYLGRVYGNEFVGQYLPSIAAGDEGTLNQNFGTDGMIDIAYTVIEPYSSVGSSAVTMVTQSNGYTFIGFANGQIAQLTNGGVLNGSFGGFGGFSYNGTNGGNVQSMMIDGNNQLMVVGTSVGDYNLGWIVRYLQGDSGRYDNTFNGTGLIHLVNYFVTNIVQQSLGRYIVTAQLTPGFSSGVGQILAYTTSGTLDTTFAGNDGIFDATVNSPLYTLVADQYDRIIYAYKDGSSLTLARLTSSGQYDDTFGSAGRITPAMSSILADSDAQVHVALNASNNIILAARTSTGISVMAYANTTGISIVENQLTITTLTNPVLTSVVGQEDGTVLLAGYQSGSNPMWVARVKDNGSSTYILDTTFGTSGIMSFSFDVAGTVTARQLNDITVYGDGEIAMIGYESDSANDPAITPFMAMAYNEPYETQTLSGLDEQLDGTPDQTFGVTTNVGNGILFYGSTVTDPTWSQVAQAIAMQDDDTILVAVGGNVYNDSSEQIILNVFNVDGLLNTDFNSDATAPFSPGQALVLNSYDLQSATDMVALTTAAGIYKCIVAGTAYNAMLGLAGSLVIQYDITNEQLDTTFGGLNGNPVGVAFGDGQQANTVGLQSNGRIIVSGLDKSGNGLVLGYNPAGNLDQGFGQGGTFVQGTTGIYAQTIDTLDRIVIAYNDGSDRVAIARILSDGSTLDTTFGVGGVIAVDDRIPGVDGNNMRIALKADGTIVVAATINDGIDIVINNWDSNGTGIIASITIGVGGSYNLLLHSFTIKSLLIDSTGKVIVIGHDYAALNGYIIALRTQSISLAADSTFNPDDTPGYIKYRVGDETNMGTRDGLIHPDGRIIIAGSRVAP